MVLSPAEELTFLNELPREAAVVLIPADQRIACAVGALLVNNPCCLLPGNQLGLTWHFQQTRNRATIRFYMGVVFHGKVRRPLYVGFVTKLISHPEHPGLIVVDTEFVGHDCVADATRRLLEAIIK